MMNRTATFTLKKQVKGRGYYAGIELELLSEQEAEESTIEVEYADSTSEKMWDAAVKQGVHQFLQYFQPYPADPRKCSIRVTDIRWMIVDSTDVLMTFVTIIALGRLFAFPVENFVFFDKETGEIHW